MDLLVLILILLSGYIIKYLIDTINSLNNEIREIKMKCISPQNDVKFNNDSSSSASGNNNKTQNDAAKATAATAALIKNITYFKDYFDNVE
jgi:FtsZ-binding cell division protein ZapB